MRRDSTWRNLVQMLDTLIARMDDLMARMQKMKLARAPVSKTTSETTGGHPDFQTPGLIAQGATVTSQLTVSLRALHVPPASQRDLVSAYQLVVCSILHPPVSPLH